MLIGRVLDLGFCSCCPAAFTPTPTSQVLGEKVYQFQELTQVRLVLVRADQVFTRYLLCINLASLFGPTTAAVTAKLQQVYI